MPRQKIYIKLINWVIILAAYCYLAYKLVTFDNYADVVSSFHTADGWQYLCLIVCICLFPLNIWLESWRWRYIMRNIEPMTMLESQRQVYYGFIGAFLTPYRAGDFPARAMLLKDKKKNWLLCLIMGAVSGYAITMVIILLGIPSSFFFFAGEEGLQRLWLPIVAGVICIVLLLFSQRIFVLLARHSWRYQKTQQVLDTLAAMTLRENLIILGQSTCRYVCFLLQLYLVLHFCGVELTLGDALVCLPSYYLLITLTPYVPVAELGVRGSWAMVVFGKFVPDASAAAVIAACILWIINTIPPMIIGSFMKPKN